ncbi:MAG: hypothetical protein ACYDEB_07175 [Dehalococcoidia bacterium]
MKREIVLLDVTEMSGVHVCVAGIDPASCEQIRLADPTPTRAHLRRLGGLAPGDLIVVDCQPLRRPTPPHTEDARWASLVKMRTLDFDELYAIASRCGFRSIEDAFGPAAGAGASGNHFWPPGRGSRSLATVPARYVRTTVDDRGTPRAVLRDADDAYYRSVPFQDLAVRTHLETCGLCERDSVALLRQEFDGNNVLVRIGLTRPYSPDERPPACWLQVTNAFARPRAHFR